MTGSNRHKDEHPSSQPGQSGKQAKERGPAAAVGGFFVWLLHQLWRLLTLRRRRRMAATQEAEVAMKAALKRRDELQKKAKKEADRALKQGALNRILTDYDFNNGKSLSSGGYAPLHELLDKADIADTLLLELNMTTPKRPLSSRSDQELWNAIGGHSPDIENALGHLLVDGDPVSQASAADILVHLRRELTPIVNPDDHIKNTAELAARAKVLGVSEKCIPAVLNKILMRLERKARWILIRELRPDPKSQRRSSNPGRSSIVR